MHIGLIGGIGLAATEYYYRGLIDRHAASGTALDLTIVHADVRDLAENLARGEAQKQAAIFGRLVQRLAAAGARIAAVTSMGSHFCIRELEALTPLPILNAIGEVDREIARRKLKSIGIIGTRNVMETGLYGGITSAKIVLPEGKSLELVHKSYIEMAIAGRVSDAHRNTFFSVGERLCRVQGADAVMLGGTDLCLAFDGRDCGFPVLDCAAVHIEAIYRRSVAET